jgi:hypothetical protein
MELSEMQRLKALEDENRRLKQIVAEQGLDIGRIIFGAQAMRYGSRRQREFWRRLERFSLSSDH